MTTKPNSSYAKSTYSVSQANLTTQRSVFFFLVLFLPLGGTLLAFVFSPFIGFSVLDALIIFIGYLITGIGVEVGFHRCFSHQAFVPVRILKILLGIVGSMSLQGPVAYWVSHHRRHHELADREGDPHSPCTAASSKPGFLLATRGIIHAHVGWVFSSIRASPGHYARDILKDRDLRLVDKFYFAWAFASIFGPPIIVFGVTADHLATARAFLWGSCFRILLVQQMTFGVNSIAHLAGTRQYDTPDSSRNLPSMSLLSFGGYLHNNHHALPWAANTGFRWCDCDTGGLVIWIFAKLNIVRHVRWAHGSTNFSVQGRIRS